MKNILKWNPEFAKNIWLEFSMQRLIVMPALLFVITLLITMNANDNSVSVLHYVSLSGFALIGMVWGIKSAADAILDEYNEKTWDWQRMSVIGPWKLAMGKLFGSTIYNWYGALMCWGLFVFTAFFMEDTENQLQLAVLLIIGMISVHGMMILISLLMIRKADGKTGIKSNRIIIPGFIVLAYFLSFLENDFSSSSLLGVSWYGLLTHPFGISLLSSLFFCFWVVAGLYRSMRTELQFANAPNWWLLFLISSFFFQYGFFAGSELPFLSGITMALGSVFAQYLFLVYFLSFSEPKDVVNFRLLLNSLRQRNYRLFFQNAPLWLITLPLAFLAGALCILFLNISFSDSATKDILNDFNIHGSGRVTLLLFAVFGFVLRDIGILLLLNFSSRSKRADAAMIVYLLFLYVLMPLLLKDFGIGAIFYPDISANPFLMAILPVAEAAIVSYLLVQKWGRLEAENNPL